MIERNNLAKALFNWISQGGNPLDLLGANPINVDKEVRLAPAEVKLQFSRYYPFHCTNASNEWLKSKCAFWLESMRKNGNTGVFDTLDPVAFSPPPEPKHTRIPRSRIRHRRVEFNRNNIVFFTLRQMGIKKRADFGSRRWSDIVNSVHQRIMQDPVLREACDNKMAQGSLDRLVQENIMGYRAYKPPEDESSFYDAFYRLYLDSGGSKM